MSGLSVQIDRLCVGRGSLDLNKMLPNHKKKIESFIANYFSKHNFTHAPLSFSEKDFQVILKEAPDCKGVKRVIEYYQNMGVFPRVKMTRHETALLKAASHVSVEAMRKASIPGTTSQIIAGTRIADDTISFVKNILFAVPSIGSDDPIVGHLGDYAGVLYTFFGLRELDGGWTDHKRATLIKDVEGSSRAKTRIASGSIVTGAALSYVAGKILETFKSPAAAGLLGGANVLFGAGYALSMGSSLMGWTRCHRFNRRLDEYLLNPHFTQVERLQGALRFLRDSITITPEEVVKITSEIEKTYPHLTKGERENILREKMDHLVEIKVKHLKRRTSNSSLTLILNNADSILSKLASKDKQAEGIKDATLLIQKVQSANWTKMTMYILSFLAATISVIATIFAAIALGPTPFILYGIGGAIYLSLSVYTAIGVHTRSSGQSPSKIGVGVSQLSGLSNLIPV